MLLASLLIRAAAAQTAPEDDLPVMPSPLDPEPVVEGARETVDLCDAVNRAVTDRSSGFASLRGTPRPDAMGGPVDTWDTPFAVSGATEAHVRVSTLGGAEFAVVLASGTRADATRVFKAASAAMESCTITSGMMTSHTFRSGAWRSLVLLPFDMLGTNPPGFATARVEVALRPGFALSGPKPWVVSVRVYDDEG